MSTAQDCFNSGLTGPSAELSKGPMAPGLGLDPQKSAQHHPEEHGFSLDHCSAETAVLNVQEDSDIPHRWEHLELATVRTRTQLCPEILSQPC